MPPLTIQQAMELALQRHQAGQFAEAAQIYREILAVNPFHSDASHLLGLVAYQLGSPEAALPLIERAIAICPGTAHYHNSLGLVLAALNRKQEALTSYHRALQIDPAMREAYLNLGDALQDQGKLDHAEAAYRAAIQSRPEVSDAHYRLGNLLRKRGDFNGCIDVWHAALEITPNDPAAWNNLGLVLAECGRFDEAITATRRALELKPHNANASTNLGLALAGKGMLHQAIEAYQNALKFDPNLPEAHFNLGNIYNELRHYDEAIAAYREAIRIQPAFTAAYNNLGNLLKARGQFAEAIAAYRKGLEFQPHSPEALSGLAATLKNQGLLDEAVIAFRQSIAANPSIAETYNNLGNALKDQGLLDEAIGNFRAAMALKPTDASYHSNLLFTLHYHPELDAETIRQEHQRWNEQHGELLTSCITPHGNDRSPSRRLNIGYVSPDFRDHAVGRFVLPLLENHDHENFAIFCYSNCRGSDAVMERLRAHTDQWRDIADLPDWEVSERIRDDQIDILIDLAGHTAGNRLLIFARKPAPVQVSWLGYPNRTGLRTIDYRLTDAHADPGDFSESNEPELLIQLPETAWCCEPRTNESVQPLPALQVGYVTFGCFNNFAKVNDRLLAIWARVLRAAGNARLLIATAEGSHRQHALEVLREHGVDPERIEFLGRCSTEEYWARFHRTDIVLDTFPYHGTSTTCDALWMGVPAVSLAGSTHVSRVGVSLLSNVGLAELIASTEEDYVRISAGLANNLPRLRELRATLRERMRTSPLMNGGAFARNMETVYRTIWQRWTEAPATVPAEMWIQLKGGGLICVPSSPRYLTSYVLLEQEDWFEREITFVRRFLRPGMQALDVGANYGVYALSMAMAVGSEGSVWAYEPASATAGLLKKTIARNALPQLHLMQTAVSAREGTGYLNLHENSELNGFSDVGGSRMEKVQVTTLDGERARLGWRSIDLVKLDAEGEEARILIGGDRFFAEESPLLLFEWRHGTEINTELATVLQERGYSLYRLIGPDTLLVPVQVNEPIDCRELNLFACKRDRAERLEQEGHLILRADREASYPDGSGRCFCLNQAYANAFPIILNAQLAKTYDQALDAYAAWRDLARPNHQRYAALQFALNSLKTSASSHPSPAHLSTLARASYEAGEISLAVQILGHLIDAIAQGALPPIDEPFWPASARFDLLPPGDLAHDWFKAAVVEAFEKLRTYSSYFAPGQTLPLLDWFQSTPFASPEMERRRRLQRKLTGIYSPNCETPLLAHRRPDHLNPEHWNAK